MAEPIEILRDAIFGNPPSPVTKPSREGVLAAFTKLLIHADQGIAAAALSGADLAAAMLLVEPLAERAEDAYAAALQAVIAAQDAEGRAQEISDAFPGQLRTAVDEIFRTVANQPAFAELIAKGSRQNSTTEARALIYGISKVAEQRLFAAEAVELAFADNVYREGYATTALADVPGIEIYNGPPVIDGRGVLVINEVTIGLLRPNTGDVTVIVEASLPSGADRKVRTIAAYVGSDEFSRVAINRNEDGIYTMQLYHPLDGLQIAIGPQDPAARRIRIAFSIGDAATRVSFDGGPVLTIATRRPETLLRLWLGRFALGYLDQIDGRILRAAHYPHGVSNALLQQMAGGPVAEDDLSSLIDERIRSHDNDDRAHNLDGIVQSVGLADSQGGTWTVAAADNFNAADGPLTTAPVGGQAWTGGDIARSGGKAVSPDQALRGSYLVTDTSNGQVEAELDPGNDHAALYFRLANDTNSCFLLLRGADSVIRLFRFPGSVAISPLIYRPYAVGEKIKVRFVGTHIWIIRSYQGEDEVLYELDDAFNATATGHGIRISGTGKVDNFRVLNREPI